MLNYFIVHAFMLSGIYTDCGKNKIDSANHRLGDQVDLHKIS